MFHFANTSFKAFALQEVDLQPVSAKNLSPSGFDKAGHLDNVEK